MNHPWQSPPTTYHLGTNEIHVWAFSLARSPAETAALRQLLNDAEQARADRFYFAHHQRHFTVARGRLRQFIGRYLDRDPAAIQFDYGHNGKPFVPDVPLRFNLSHAHGMGLVGFCLHEEIGVDIEPVRQMDDAANVARRFFSATEVAAFTAVADAEKPQAFFNCWTRKEAFIKAVGDGLSYPLDQFALTLKPDRTPRFLTIRGDTKTAAAWSLFSLTPAPDYVGAVAIHGRNWQLQCFQHP